MVGNLNLLRCETARVETEAHDDYQLDGKRRFATGFEIGFPFLKVDTN